MDSIERVASKVLAGSRDRNLSPASRIQAPLKFCKHGPVFQNGDTIWDSGRRSTKARTSFVQGERHRKANSGSCGFSTDPLRAYSRDEHANAGNSTLLNRPGRGGEVGVSTEDSQDCPTLDPTTRLGKRRRLDPSLHYERELKRRCSTLLGGLQEVVKATEEWDAILCANLDFNRTREEELLAEIDARKKKETLLLDDRGELIIKIAAQKEREALLLQERQQLLHEIDVRKNTKTLLIRERQKLFHKISGQKEREVLLLQERKKFLHEIDVRKKTKTLLIQERKKLFQKISAQKERETLLQGYKELTDARRKTKAVLLQARKELLSNIDAQKKTETVLLQERIEIINCLSKKIGAQKKREKKLLHERRKDEVKLRKALDKQRYLRATVSDRTINILWDVTQKILALTVDVEESQLVGKFAYKTKTPRAKSRLKMPSTLPSSWEEAKEVINRAEVAFTEAARNWKRAQNGIELMESCCREGLLDRILGRKERASEPKTALRDILDESQTMEQKSQVEHINLSDVELKERRSSRPPSKEQKREPRKRKSPQRFVPD